MGGCGLTWVASGALGERVGQVGQLAHVVAVLQGAHVHVVPAAELAEPRAPLLAFGVGVEHDAHPQGAWRDGHARLKTIRKQPAPLQDLSKADCVIPMIYVF